MGNSRISRGGQEAREGARGGADIPEDWLVPFLLLCLRYGGSYAHQLEAELGELGFDGMRPGEMHQALWRMEWEEMVLCDHEDGGYRLPRRWYEITEAGEAYLEFWTDSLVRYQEEVDLFFRTYHERAARGARE